MSKLVVAVIALGILLLVTSLVFNVMLISKDPITEKQLAQQAALEKAQYTLSVYAEPKASESELLVLKAFIESQDGVVSVRYTSAGQALTDFRARNDNRLAQDALQELGENPFGANLVITIDDPSIKQSLGQVIKHNYGQLISTINY